MTQSPSPSSRIVVFDLGKVLLDFDYGKLSRAVAKISTAGGEAIRKLIDHSPLLFRYETGLIDREYFFHEVRQATGFRGTLAEFVPLFSDIFEPIPEMIELHAKLRQQRVPVYIFSNTNDMAIEHIRRAYPFFSQFDGYIYSFEQGAMKPDPRIYTALENLTGRTGTDIVYLDDRAENVAGGTARGWVGIHHVSNEGTMAALREQGFKI